MEWDVWSLFVNCVAAACAPAIAALRFEDFCTSDPFDLGKYTATDPGFNENWSLGSGIGNFTGNGHSTGVRPRTAASYI